MSFVEQLHTASVILESPEWNGWVLLRRGFFALAAPPRGEEARLHPSWPFFVLAKDVDGAVDDEEKLNADS